MDFISVVTHPLGLAGFALALVFGVLSKTGRKRPAWWPPLAMGLAAVTLVGGLLLAYAQTRPPGSQHPASPTAVSPQGAPSSGATQVETHGPGSPVFLDSKAGSVTINVGTPPAQSAAEPAKK